MPPHILLCRLCAGGKCVVCGLEHNRLTLSVDSSFNVTASSSAPNSTASCGPLTFAVTGQSDYYVFIGSLSGTGAIEFLSARPLLTYEPLVSVGDAAEIMELIFAETPEVASSASAASNSSNMTVVASSLQSNLSVVVALNGQQFASMGSVGAVPYETPTVYQIVPASAFADEDATVALWTGYVNRSSIFVRLVLGSVVRQVEAVKVADGNVLSAAASSTSTSSTSALSMTSDGGAVALQSVRYAEEVIRIKRDSWC